MPDWIGDQIAGVGPEATRVFGRNAQILLKKSEIEVPRKSGFRARSVVSTSSCHSRALERVVRGKIGHSAERLRNLLLGLPAVFGIVIEAEIRVFQPLSANSGRSVTAYRIGQLDPNRSMSMRAPNLTNSACLKPTQKLRLFHRELLLGQNVFLAQLREALNRLYDVLSRG